MTVHTCHAIGCTVPVPPRMSHCRAHWFSLPKAYRDAIWATYRRGQERDKQPSRAYLKAANAARHWLHQAEGHEESVRCLVCVDLRAAAPAGTEREE